MSAAALFAAAAMAMPGMGVGATGGDTVAIPGKYYSPGDLTVLVGQTVTWRNDDAISHTVTAEDGLFSSGPVPAGGSFQQTFDAPGTYRYFCTIHRQMRGTIEVAALGLSGPDGVLMPGDDAMFDLLAPPGSGPVSLERLTAGGAQPAGEVTPGDDGRASFRVAVDRPGSYRARAGALTSPVVRLAVAPHVTATAVRRGRRVTVRAAISPAVPGATVQLQRYVPERFDYLPVRAKRTAGGAGATFSLTLRRRAALRVAVVKAPGGWAPGRSAHFVVRPATH